MHMNVIHVIQAKFKLELKLNNSVKVWLKSLLDNTIYLTSDIHPTNDPIYPTNNPIYPTDNLLTTFPTRSNELKVKLTVIDLSSSTQPMFRLNLLWIQP